MGAIKYLIPLWVAIAVYSLSSIFVGTIGLSAYDQLLAERDKQLENMETLRFINKDLAGTRDALWNKNKDVIGVYARELGYGSPREHFVRIVGFMGVRKQQTETGQIVIAAKPESVSDKTLKWWSFSIGFVLFICFFIFDLLQGPQRKRSRPKIQKEQ